REMCNYCRCPIPIHENECAFPFQYGDEIYNSCTTVDDNKPWCSTRTDSQNKHVAKYWKYCKATHLPAPPTPSLTTVAASSSNGTSVPMDLHRVRTGGEITTDNLPLKSCPSKIPFP
ncbi:unnamed protein product, partial [Meganyctiphanes norvegica]